MVAAGKVRNLIFILGDQLSRSISSLRDADPSCDVILMCEVDDETCYVPHHKQKIVFVLSAMRHFAQELRDDGWQVDYVHLDDHGNPGSFTKALKQAVARHSPGTLIVTEAGEWRVQEMIRAWEKDCGVAVDVREDDRFICSHAEFDEWASGRKELRMEYFYREMRRKTGFLMEGGEPAGGKWNYDTENRKPAERDMFMPGRREFRPDDTTKDVIALVAKRFADNIGRVEPFRFAVTRAEARKALKHFVAEKLDRFGDYQDAMLNGEPYLWHSLISGYINIGLLDPVEVCEAVQQAWADGDAPLNAAEGFIRQIIGWREYVRGIYWRFMPDYVDRNYFEAHRDLPQMYWSGETKMNCMRAAIGQTRDEAYAHHIQRLMITGNFALVAGIEPQQVHEWYLAVYFDAFEWVELPNTLGMSQFADGGLLGSKPYAASGAYINRMSDYCSGCHYDVNAKHGEGSCPFNSLYWEFLVRNRNRLKSNLRLKRIYSNWDRIDSARQRAYRETAAHHLQRLGEL